MLKVTDKQQVSYCIPIWLRDQQVLSAMRRGLPRIEPHDKRDERIAIVGFAPSLKETWEKLRDFTYIITVSGSHKFLIERGIVPTWHVEVDPREHKVTLLGDPHANVHYLPASCCHPKYFDHLAGFKASLWHVFDNNDDAIRILPREEWAITGGCNVGLRAMTIARFFGFRDQHVFGMDGCEGAEAGKKHAAPHPLQDGTASFPCEYPEGSGKIWRTTPSLLESAKQTFHELNMMPDVKATFYGEGLVQEMAKHYVPEYKQEAKDTVIAITRPQLISEDYRALNKKLHDDNLFYGVGGAKHAPTVLKLAESMNTTSILDYGCGKGMLGKEIPFPIWEYDPAIPTKSELPRPADIVVCSDVLEHIEPECIRAVLDDLRRVTRKVGYFVIHTGPAAKTLPDGRNTHLLQRPRDWWQKKLGAYFEVGKILESGPLLHVIVGPRREKAKKVA